MENINELLEKIGILENKFNNAVINNLNAKVKGDLASKISELSNKLATLYAIESNKYNNKASSYDDILYSYQKGAVEVNNFYGMLLDVMNDRITQKYAMLKIEFDEYGYTGRVHGSDQHGVVHYDYFLLAPDNLINVINQTKDLNNFKLAKIINEAMLSGIDIFISSSNIVLDSVFSFFKVKHEIIRESHNADIYHAICDRKIHAYSKEVVKYIAEYGFDNSFENINQIKIKARI